MRHLKLTYNLLVALIAIAGFSGCSQDEFVEEQEMQPQIEAQLMLSISCRKSAHGLLMKRHNPVQQKKVNAANLHCLS